MDALETKKKEASSASSSSSRWRIARSCELKEASMRRGSYGASCGWRRPP